MEPVQHPRSPARLRDIQLGLYLAVELGWLLAMSSVLGASFGPSRAGPLLSVPLVLVLLLIATGVTRLALRRQSAPRRLQLGIAALGVVAAGLVGVSQFTPGNDIGGWIGLLARSNQTVLGLPVLGAMAQTIIIWWRGITSGRNRMRLDDVESGLRFATTALALIFVLNAINPPDHAAPLGAMVSAAMLVLFAGLTGLPFARIMDLGANPRNRDQPALGINRYWLGMLLGTNLTVLLVTIVLALAFTFDRIDQVARPLIALADTLLGWIIYAIALPLGYLIEGLIYLFRLLVHQSGQPPPPMPNTNLLAQLRDQASQGTGPPEVLAIVAKWVLVGSLVLIVLVLLARAVGHYVDTLSSDDVAEERDFVLTWRGVAAAFGEWLRGIFRTKQLLLPWSRPGAPIVEKRGSQTLDPRELYRELLFLGARLGRRRALSETPREYERRLDDGPPLAEGNQDIQTLTDVYVQARYASVPPIPVKVAAAREALDRLLELEKKSGEGTTKI